jgi:hypothetical protein
MRIVVNLFLISMSLVFSILASELLARIMLDPIDYLLPRLVSDDFLLHRVEGYSGGHDAWGFRNIRKPASADIVCVGDSMTYGISATAHDSWPIVLGRIRATSVYNMGLGGYGPIQYLYLMGTKGVQLHPKIVIVGFYFGNDFLDVYNEVRFNKRWSAYGRFGNYDIKTPAFAHQVRPGKFFGGLRDWLAHHSLFYALLTRSPMFDFIRRREMVTAMANDPDNLIAYRDDKHYVIFNLAPSARFLDMDDPRIKFAIVITKQVMLDMRALAEKERFRLIVALIPTKESVYGDLVTRAGYIKKYPSLADAIQQENVARHVIESFLHQSNIEVVDLLPELEAKVDERDLYPLTDGHPNKNGYRVIAETINNYLNSPR